MLTTLDIIGAILGIIYILLEYRASIWLWAVSIIMPIVDMFLYFNAGLYADFGMAIYYALAAIYGFVIWKAPPSPPEGGIAETKESLNKNIDSTSDSPLGGTGGASPAPKGAPPTHFPLRLVIPTLVVFLAVWTAIYFILVRFTNSTVPLTDSFTSALSIIALWALAHKYIEQWLLWIIVDAISCALYTYKGIPFKASLYGLYVVIAVFGYRKWCRMAREATAEVRA